MKRFRLVMQLLACAGLFAAFGAARLSGDHSLKTIVLHPKSTEDFSNLATAVSLADAVFIAKVTHNLGPLPEDPIPQTLFRARVDSVLKGHVGETVLLDQAGGRDEESRDLYLVDGDPLLVQGKSYLFIVFAHANGQWLTPIPIFGDVAIRSSDHQRHLGTRVRDLLGGAAGGGVTKVAASPSDLKR